MSNNKVILIILDGWGHGQIPAADAIQRANTPFVDSLYQKYPHTELITYGEEVGLPKGQMGNSEVGHLNIGAGRIVYQDLAKINREIEIDVLKENEALKKLMGLAQEKQKTVHLMGLLSDGGVHAHINHLKATVDILEANGIAANIHAFMDGRDTDPNGGLYYLQDLEKFLSKKKSKIATIIGRYFAMDRDQRWERTKLAYDLLVNGKGEKIRDISAAIQKSYDADTSDEFIQPLVICDDQQQAVGTIKANDIVLFFNYRTDRPRQITQVLTQEDIPDHEMKKLDLHFFTMTEYNESFKNVDVLYRKDNINKTLGEVLADAGKTQVRIAETEKYPHVTFFFSGGQESLFAGERRILVPSPKVATYDLQPEMSAKELTKKIIEDIQQNQPDFICLNFANTDMVGHTGDFGATMKAATTVDDCLKEMTVTLFEHDYTAIVIADHGNSDFMINEDGSPNTAHTTNPVPCFLVSKNKNNPIHPGKLADIAPTVLDLMGLQIPPEMTGQSLIKI